MPVESINVPLVLSWDTRGVDAATNQATNALDQRRINCIYKITRGVQGAEPTASLVRRQGVTQYTGTYGAGTQVPYLVTKDPARSWGSTGAWAIVKDSTNIKACSTASSTTVLASADYVPRFVDQVRLAGVDYVMLQLQNITTPDAADGQKVYLANTLDTWTQISATNFTSLHHRGKMEELDGYLMVAANKGIYASDANDETTWAATNYIRMSSTNDDVQGLARLKRKILLFGQETVETFEIPVPGNTTGSILSRVANTVDRVGLADVAGPSSLSGRTHYYATVNDLLFYVGRYHGTGPVASLVVYDGQRHSKLSREYEDALLRSSTIYGVYPYSMDGQVFVAMQLTAPGAATQRALLYAIDLNDFFLLEATEFSPVNNGYQYIGVRDPQKLYYFGNADKWIDHSATFTMSVQFKLPMRDTAYKDIDTVGVIGDTMATSENLGVQFSKDDGQNWTTARNIDMSKMHKMLHKGPVARDLTIRLTHVGTKEVRLRRFFSEVR